MVACVEDDAPPPFELHIAWQMTQYHALPRDGGLFNQPIRLMRTARTAQTVYDALMSYNATNAGARAKWAKTYPQWARARSWALDVVASG